MVKETKSNAVSAVVFLDVDGVLNRNSTKPRDGVREVCLTPHGQTRVFTGLVETALVEMLARTLEECGARIVVSSSWRNAFQSAAEFAAAIGIAPPLASARDMFHRDWRTDWKMSSQRSQEIRWWLNEHKSVKRYAILDDHDVCVRDRELEPHFVQTDSNVGVTKPNLDRVASILRRQSAVIS